MLNKLFKSNKKHNPSNKKHNLPKLADEITNVFNTNTKKVFSNVQQNNQLYQLENITILYVANFNVWQVIDNRLPSWEKIIFEVVGINGDKEAFDFAREYLKKIKYGVENSTNK
jgi:hypothetical protein